MQDNKDTVLRCACTCACYVGGRDDEDSFVSFTIQSLAHGPSSFFDAFLVPWRYLQPTLTHHQAHQTYLVLRDSCCSCLCTRVANRAGSWIFPFAAVVSILAFDGYPVRFHAASPSNQHDTLTNMPPICRATICAAFQDPHIQRWQSQGLAWPLPQERATVLPASPLASPQSPAPCPSQHAHVPYTHSHFPHTIPRSLTQRQGRATGRTLPDEH
jgi:hypothetical protein